MRNLLPITIAAFTAAGAPLSALADDAPAPGTPAAAVQVAVDMISMLYAVPKDKISVDTPDVQAKFILVHARIPGKECEIPMRLNPDANAMGWEARGGSCKAPE